LPAAARIAASRSARDISAFVMSGDERSSPRIMSCAAAVETNAMNKAERSQRIAQF